MTDVFILTQSDDPELAGAALVLAQSVRRLGVSCIVDARAVRLKNKLKWAVESGAFFAAIVGPDELAAGQVQVKDLDARTQSLLPLSAAARHIAIEIWTEPVIRLREMLLEEPCRPV